MSTEATNTTNSKNFTNNWKVVEIDPNDESKLQEVQTLILNALVKAHERWANQEDTLSLMIRQDSQTLNSHILAVYDGKEMVGAAIMHYSLSPPESLLWASDKTVSEFAEYPGNYTRLMSEPDVLKYVVSRERDVGIGTALTKDAIDRSDTRHRQLELYAPSDDKAATRFFCKTIGMHHVPHSRFNDFFDSPMEGEDQPDCDMNCKFD